MKSLNLLQFIFGALLLLKITHTGNVAEWSWFWVVLPLILDVVVKFFSWIWDTVNFSREMRIAVQDFYFDYLRKDAVKKAEKELRK